MATEPLRPTLYAEPRWNVIAPIDVGMSKKDPGGLVRMRRINLESSRHGYREVETNS